MPRVHRFTGSVKLGHPVPERSFMWEPTARARTCAVDLLRSQQQLLFAMSSTLLALQHLADDALAVRRAARRLEGRGRLRESVGFVKK